jgi:hypothetical protein
MRYADGNARGNDGGHILQFPGATSTMRSSLIKRPLLTLAWTSAGLAVVAGALYLGYELRKRRFSNQSPYESYSHAGDDGAFNGADYGVGI